MRDKSKTIRTNLNQPQYNKITKKDERALLNNIQIGQKSGRNLNAGHQEDKTTSMTTVSY